VRAVQVRVDKGSWRDVRLADAPGRNTWVQWVHEWDATPGQHTIECRVIDRTGAVQVEERASTRPNGTTGLDSKFVTVT
jgi:sulfite oxidase